MPTLLVAQTEMKAAEYVLTRVLKKILVLSVVTASRLVECAAMKKKEERYSEMSLLSTSQHGVISQKTLSP